ncbi:hypothetical protein LJC18_00875 [Lachnospiraceae bacterium OttesenSCG-928-E19]|nr:hypothetical protein [Lachnospiraceae bacterium OttesenSCG-928-E19]
MSKKNEQFYRNAIEATRPDVYIIKTPKITGMNLNTFVVETNEGLLIYKANKIEIIQKNLRVNYLMDCLNIPVAKTRTVRAKGQSFEVYPYSTDKTLFEHIQNGMPETMIKNAFKDMASYLAFMSELNKSDMGDLPYKSCAQIINSDISARKNPMVGAMCYGAVSLLNIGNQRIMHFGMTPKNVLVNDKGQITRVLDIDSVGICNETFALSGLISEYQNLGFDPSEILASYEEIAKRPISKRKVIRQTKLNQYGKGLYQLIADKKQAFK